MQEVVDMLYRCFGTEHAPHPPAEILVNPALYIANACFFTTDEIKETFEFQLWNQVKYWKDTDMIPKEIQAKAAAIMDAVNRDPRFTSRILKKETEVIPYEIWRILLGEDIDPWKEAKQQLNDAAEAHFEDIEQVISNSDNPIFTAMVAAARGNRIDLNIGEAAQTGKIDMPKLIGELTDTQNVSYRQWDFKKVEKVLTESDNFRNLLYLADNCGEIVADLILIKKLFNLGHSITIAVRKKPVINDMAISDRADIEAIIQCHFPEALSTGRINIISSGSEEVGSDLRFASREFIDAWKSCDLVIAKGLGNWESFRYNVLTKPVLFLMENKDPKFIIEQEVVKGVPHLLYLPSGTIPPIDTFNIELLKTRKAALALEIIQKLRRMNFEQVKETIKSLVDNILPSSISDEIEKSKTEKPCAETVLKPPEYKTDMYTLDDARLVKVVDGPDATYFDYYRSLFLRQTKDIIFPAIRKKMQEGILIISEWEMEFLDKNLWPALDNLLCHEHAGSITRLDFIRIMLQILTQIGPDLYEDIKKQSIAEIEPRYAELREIVRSKGKKDAFKTAMSFCAMGNMFEAIHDDASLRQLSIDELEGRGIDINGFFERLDERIEENESGTIMYYLDNAGELPLDMIVVELLMDQGFDVVLVAKGSFAFDDITVREVNSHLNRWLSDLRFKWLRKYYHPESPDKSRLRVMSTDVTIPGVDLARIGTAHEAQRQDALFSVYKGGGNHYTTYTSALTQDSFYMYALKEPIQIACAKAHGVSAVKAKKGGLVFEFKEKYQRGLSLTDLVRDGKHITNVASEEVQSLSARPQDVDTAEKAASRAN
ncbi:MAG: ARMT1-like domain-containing protein [bacterium]